MLQRVRFLITGLEDQGDGTSLQFDWADRLAIGGFHADGWHWLRKLGLTSHCPLVVNNGSYPGGRCRCSHCQLVAAQRGR